MKHIKLFEAFLGDDSIEAGIIPFLKFPEGYKAVVSDDINVPIIKDGKEVGFYRFSGIGEFDDVDYVIAETIFVEPEHRRKGIYGAIINAALEYCKKTGKANGVVSFPFDADSGDFERSKDANAFWENLVSKKMAEKHDTEDGIVYTTINKR